jgi:hypothetical protein
MGVTCEADVERFELLRGFEQERRSIATAVDGERDLGAEKICVG